MTLPLPEMEMHYTELMLERLRFRSYRRISQRVLAEHMKPDIVLDDALDSLVVSLEGEVLADKVLTETAEIPFAMTAPVPAPKPRRRYAGPLAVGLGAVLGLAGALSGLLALEGAAMLLAFVGVVALAEPDPIPTREVHVRGTVQMDATHYATFPESTTPYPDDLGPVVRRTVLSEPVPRDYAVEGR